MLYLICKEMYTQNQKSFIGFLYDKLMQFHTWKTLLRHKCKQIYCKLENILTKLQYFLAELVMLGDWKDFDFWGFWYYIYDCTIQSY